MQQRRSRLALSAFVALLALGSAAAGYTQAEMTKSFLVSTRSRSFCAPMIQPITMENVAPSSFSPPCKPDAYRSAVALATVGPIFMAVLTVVAFIAFCVGRFCLHKCGGPRAFRVLFHEEEREIALARLYSKKSRVYLVIALAVAAFVVVLGAVWIAVISAQLRDFTYAAGNIFNTHAQVMATTADQVMDSASALAPLDPGVLAATTSAVSSFESKTSKFTASLHALDGLRTTFALGTAMAAVAVSVGGLAAAFAGWSRASLALGLAAFGVVFCLWINVAIPQAAANVFFDLCTVINGCHYCYTGGFSPCPYCRVNFFEALSECSPEAAATFAPLAGALATGSNLVAGPVVTAVAELCATVQCVGTVPASPADVLAFGLTDMLVSTSGNVPGYVSVAALAVSSYPGAAAAAKAVAALSPATEYVALGVQLATLNCSAPNAFVESVVPVGTFDALQKHLCPHTEYPPHPPQIIFAQLAIANMLTAGAMVVVLAVLLLGHKRFRAGASDGETVDQATWLLRPSMYAAYGAASARPAVAAPLAVAAATASSETAPLATAEPEQPPRMRPVPVPRPLSTFVSDERRDQDEYSTN